MCVCATWMGPRESWTRESKGKGKSKIRACRGNLSIKACQTFSALPKVSARASCRKKASSTFPVEQSPCQPFLSDNGLLDLSHRTKALSTFLVEQRPHRGTSWWRMPLLRGDAWASLYQSQGTTIRLVEQRCLCRGELHGQAQKNPMYDYKWMREKMVHTRLLGVWLTNETKYLITSTKNALYKIGCPIKKGMGGYNGGNFKLTTNATRVSWWMGQYSVRPRNTMVALPKHRR